MDEVQQAAQAAEVPVTEAATKPRKTPEEIREGARLRKQKQRGREKAASEKSAGQYFSTVPVKRAEALELLAGRIVSPHVREIVYAGLIEAAQKNELTPNEFLFRNGLQKTLQTRRGGVEATLTVDLTEIVSSEVIHNADLYGIWDAFVGWREPNTSFESFTDTRRRLKSDWIELGRFMGIPFEEKPHRSWQQFLPQFTPMTLQPGRERDFGATREWLKAQTSALFQGVKDFLLNASRGSMKTTAGKVFLITALLCAPNLRLLVVSETTRLAKMFVKDFRAFFEVSHDRTRFQYWFPEHCIKQDEGSVQTFENPMRTVNLPQESLMLGSFEQALTGSRFDIAWVDDGVSNEHGQLNSEDSRMKALTTYDGILKLREPGGVGFVFTIGTPWRAPDSDADVGDLYFELMKRNDADPDKSLAVLRQPAWILKPESAHKFPDFLNQISEDDIEELAYPSVLTFKTLLKEARQNLPLFRTQNLCEYVMSEESKWTVTFTEDELRVRVKPLSFFENAQTAMVCGSVDTAFSQAITADRSAICIGKVLQYNGKNTMVIVEVIADRWKYSELAVQIVEAFHRHGVQRAIIERSGPWQELAAAVSRAALIRGYPVPNLTWHVPIGSGTGVKAKVVRAKAAEMLLENGQLYFLPGQWNDSFFAELIRFSGKRSNYSYKDDQTDALGMLCSTFVVRDMGESKPNPLVEQQQNEDYERAALQGQYDLIFNTPQKLNPQFSPPSAPVLPSVYSTLDRFGFMKKGR